MTFPLSRHLSAALRHLLLLLLAVAVLFPFLWMLSTAAKTERETARLPLRLIPAPLDPDASFSRNLLSRLALFSRNFHDAWTKAPFGRYLLNSALVAFAVTLGVLVTSLLAGYAFALLDFPAKKFLFVLLLSTLMIPFEVTLLPNFIIVKKLKFLLGQEGLRTWWLPEYSALIVPWTASAFSIFLMRQHFAAMPRDFLDAARIDGCGHLAFLRYIGLPIVAPAAVTVAVFAFLGSWNAFTWPLLVTDNERFHVIQIGLRTFLDSEVARYNLMMAAATITILPTLLLYLGAQRFLIQGLTAGGIKE